MSDSVQVTLSLPRWLHRPLRTMKRWFTGFRPASVTVPNLVGDRDIEWSWIAANLPKGSGNVLDFGCGNSFLGLAAAEAGYSVVGFDLGEITWPWKHPRVTFRRGDITKDEFLPESFDLVINCSAVEHVGLAGRYGVETKLDDGDVMAMRRLFESMKPDGIMLLTIPVGKDAVFEPMTRIYGPARLPPLIESFELISETYWVKNNENVWTQCDRATALAFESYAGASTPLRNCYGLGCLKLRKPRSAQQPG